MKFCWVLCTLLFFVVGRASADVQAELRQYPLAGIKAMSVVVIINEQAKSIGFTQSRVQPIVEARLRRAGIKVVERWAGQPELVVYITGLKVSETDGYAFAIQVDVSQEVTLTRKPSITTHGSTWTSSSVCYCTSGTLLHLLDCVDSDLDDFVADYDAAKSMRT